MTTNEQRLAQLLAVALLVSGGIALVAGSASGQTDTPVDYESAGIEPTQLHFARVGGSNCTASGGEEATQAGSVDQPLCQMRALPPVVDSDNDAKSETRLIRSESPDDPTGMTPDAGQTNQSVTFTLDTFTNDSVSDLDADTDPNGAEFPFTIESGGSSAQIQFFYDSEAVCDEETGGPQPLDFHINLYRGSDPGTPSGWEVIGNTVKEACGTPGDDLDSGDADQVSAKIGVDQTQRIEAGEHLFLQIFAVSEEIDTLDSGANLQWSIFFQDDSRDSRIQLSTEKGTVHSAVWAEDKSGTQKDSFDPDAPSGERFLIPRLALKSPFGGEAIPSDGFSAEIHNPDDEAVDLVTDRNGDQTSLKMVEQPNLRSNDGAFKTYKIRKPADSDQPWHYPSDVATGSYEIDIDGDVLRRTPVQLERNVGMGAFAFDLAPVDGESTNHQVSEGQSTTFLLDLENRASQSETFTLDASFDFSDTASAWSVDLSNSRTTIEANDGEIVQVEVTPPDEAGPGDRARLLVEATSESTGATHNLSLEAQITDQTIRAVDILVFQDDPFNVGVAETSTFKVFAWNQGTATDSLSASIVPNSSQTDKPDEFEADLGQRSFANVEAGSIEPIPVEVTTTSDVVEGDQFSFDLRAQSKADASAAATERVETEVTAERSVALSGVDGQNVDSGDSFRWSRFNRSGSSQQCEGETFADRPDECGDFANWTYHRVMVENTGDQPEQVSLSLLPEDGRTTRVTPEESTSNPDGTCTPILPDRLKPARTGFVREISHDNPGASDLVDSIEVEPGETQVAYLRVAYNGSTPYYQDLGPGQNACEQESFKATVEASLTDGTTARMDTVTTFPFQNTDEMPASAQARLSLENRYVPDEASGTPLLENPRFVGIEPGNETVIPFTLTLQQAHEDQANLSLAAEDEVQDLVDEGWTVELVSLDNPVDRFGPRDVVVPTDEQLGPLAKGSIGHATGVDYTMGLKVAPPESGIQEDTRESFTVLAHSEEVRDETDQVSIGVQIGKQFDFGLEPGNQSLEAHPGDEVAFSLGIENLGATRDSYDIQTNLTQGNAEVSAEPDDPKVSAGTSKVSSIRVDIPEGASGGSQISVQAEVTADRGTPNDPSDDPPPKTVNYQIDVRPPSTLTMEANPSVVSVSPGGQTSLNFSITNQKDTPQNLVITQAIGPPDWDTSLSGDPVERRIGGGETITQTVLVEAPNQIFEGSQFPFVVKAANATDDGEFAVARAEATVQGDTAVTLQAEETDTRVVDRGDTVQFPVLLRNPGTSPTIYELDPSFESNGWSARFLDADEDTVLENNQIEVAEAQFERVLVEVQAPDDVDQGHVEEVVVTAIAQSDTSVRDKTTLNAEIHEFGVDLEVTGATAKDVAPGDAASFQVSITNTGNGEDQLELDFRGEDSEEPEYEVTTALEDDTTPTLAAGETLENVTVEVLVPAATPTQSPIPQEGGVTTIVQATSAGAPSDRAPTATSEVTTRLLDFVVSDVDGDSGLEVAIDENRDSSDGFEVFLDQDTELVKRGRINSTQAVSSTGLRTLDSDGDDRVEHLIDTDGDGTANVYFDPDRAQTYSIPYTFDMNGDAQTDTPIDANFDGLIDGVYDPAAGETRKALELDFSGDGRRDLLVDANGDTFYDTFVDPNKDPALVTDVERDGQLYKLDTEGNDRVDTHYNAETQSVEDAEAANLTTFLGDYWYVVVVFLAVVIAFGVIFYRQL